MRNVSNMKKFICILLCSALLFSGCATDLSSAGKSALIPGWGQRANHESKAKQVTMAVVEVAGITTTAVVGGIIGWPLVMVGVGVLIANHVWSATDAYVHADKKESALGK